MTQNGDTHNPLPEAPFSTNAYFVTTCGMKHQVTARGSNAQEMTTNYFAAVDSLKAAYAQRARQKQIDPAKLLALVGCWMKKAETIPGMPQRLIKAAQLVQAGAVTPEDNDLYVVQSQTNPETAYWVTVGTCSCQDATRHAEDATYCCKHRAAIRMYTKLTAGT